MDHITFENIDSIRSKYTYFQSRATEKDPSNIVPKCPSATRTHLYLSPYLIYASLRKDKDVKNRVLKKQRRSQGINSDPSDLLLRKAGSHCLGNSCNLEVVCVSIIFH